MYFISFGKWLALSQFENVLLAINDLQPSIWQPHPGWYNSNKTGLVGIEGFSHIMIPLIHDRSISGSPKSMWFCQGLFSLPVYLEGFSMICRSLLQEPNYPIPRLPLRLRTQKIEFSVVDFLRLTFPNWLRGLGDFINKSLEDFFPTFRTSLKQRTLWTFFAKPVGPEIWNFQSHPMSPEWNQPSASMAFTGSQSMPMHEDWA